MVVHWRSRLFTQFTGAVLAGSHLIVTIIAIYMEQNIEIQTQSAEEDKETRNVFIGAKVTPSQKEYIKSQAEKCGITHRSCQQSSYRESYLLQVSPQCVKPYLQGLNLQMHYSDFSRLPRTNLHYLEPQTI